MRLSAPYVFTVSVKSPMDPPPDRGRITASGTISAGISKILVTGVRISVMYSIAPDSRSIADTDNIAISGGIMETTVFNPSSAPAMNRVYAGSRFFRADSSIIIIRHGIT